MRNSIKVLALAVITVVVMAVIAIVSPPTGELVGINAQSELRIIDGHHLELDGALVDLRVAKANISGKWYAVDNAYINIDAVEMWSIGGVVFYPPVTLADSM